MLDCGSIRQWLSLVAQLSAVKALEMKTRKHLSKNFFEKPKVGTQHVIVDDNVPEESIQLTLVMKLNYSVKKEDLLPLIPTLTDEEKNAIKWVPEVKPKEYKKLPKGSPLRRIVSVKYATPSLSAIDSKVK